MKRNSIIKYVAIYLAAITSTFMACAKADAPAPSAKENPYIPFRYDGKYGILDAQLHVRLAPDYPALSVYDSFIYAENGNGGGTVFGSDLSVLYESEKMSHVIPVSEKYCQFWSGSLEYVTVLNVMDGETKRIDFDEQLIEGNTEAEPYYANKNFDRYTAKDFTAKLFSHSTSSVQYPFRNGLAVIHEYKGTDECFSIINSSGETVCTGLQEVGKYFCDGLLPVVMSDGSSGYLNEKWTLEIPCDFYIDYESHGPKATARLDYLFSDGIAVVCRQESAGHFWYLMDRAGNSRKLDAKYTPKGFKFHDGFLLVECNDGGNKRYDFIRKDGEARFGKPFTYAENFVNGYAVAVLDGRDVLVSADGTILDVEHDILAR